MALITKLDDERLARIKLPANVLMYDSLRAALSQLAIADRLAEAVIRTKDSIFNVGCEAEDIATEYLEGKGK